MSIFLLLLGLLTFLIFFYSVITGIYQGNFKRILISFLLLGAALIILFFISKHRY